MDHKEVFNIVLLIYKKIQCCTQGNMIANFKLVHHAHSPPVFCGLLSQD